MLKIEYVRVVNHHCNLSCQIHSVIKHLKNSELYPVKAHCESKIFLRCRVKHFASFHKKEAIAILTYPLNAIPKKMSIARHLIGIL